MYFLEENNTIHNLQYKICKTIQKKLKRTHWKTSKFMEIFCFITPVGLNRSGIEYDDDDDYK
jgi:hypothetical protein